MSDENIQSVEQESIEETAAVESSPAVTNQDIDFKTLISEDLIDKSNIKDFKSIDDMAKSYIELQRLVGGSVRIPDIDASDEAKEDFLNKIKDVDGVILKSDEDLYNKLGRPEKPEEYTFGLDEQTFENLPDVSAELDDFRSIAHDIGLTEKQASQLVTTRLRTLEAQQAAATQQRESAESELKKMWGADYDNRLQGAKQVLTVMQDKYGDAVNDLVNSPAGNNVVFLQMASELASMYKEKNHEGMSSAQFGMTPEIALDKISQKRADRGFMEAYSNVHHPQHKKAVEDLAKLYEVANGS